LVNHFLKIFQKIWQGKNFENRAKMGKGKGKSLWIFPPPPVCAIIVK